MSFAKEVRTNLVLACDLIQHREGHLDIGKGVATKEDTDKTLRLGIAHPMGPLQLGEWKPVD
jgi:3-hydroxyacyl-CoA dehydrogenase